MDIVNVRVEEKTKKAARKVFEEMGLDLSSGINLFLHRVVEEKALPFRPMTAAAAKKLRATWDKEAAWALKHGKRYASVKEAFSELYE